MSQKIHLKRETVFQLLYSGITVLAMISPGMIIGYSSVVLPVLQKNTTAVHLNEDSAALFASLPSIAQLVGCLISVTTLKYGRRIAIASGSSVCALGWIVVATSFNQAQLLIGRFLSGVGAGMCATPGGVYVAEISTPKFTALLCSLNSIFINVGALLIYIFGSLMKDDWRTIAIVSIGFPVISVVSVMLLLPESPRWLLTKGRLEDAKRCLLTLRGLCEETTEFQEEFAEMIKYSESQKKINSRSIEQGSEFFEIPLSRDCPQQEKEESSAIVLLLKSTGSCLRKAEVWKPLVIMNAYFFFQQFSGLYVFISYTVDIAVNIGVTLDPYVTATAVGVLQVIGGIALVCTGTKLGRKPSSIISGTGMSICLIILLAYNQFFPNSTPGIPLTSMLIFVSVGSFGFQNIPYAMIGEIFPTNYVNILAPFTTCMASIFNFSALQIYPGLVKINKMAPICMYAAVSIIATIFLTLFLPETKGKTKTEIEENFQKPCFRIKC
ncbi:facilitated trehalose transporter Tret1-like isoform X2 [Prorops nasuta]|uniref:facilitated trehalose transporter Tret1-like isoform X2 n=1 Tax=Prorops nasuta TaxID=863751 RepID=UPI0034CDEC29